MKPLPFSPLWRRLLPPEPLFVAQHFGPEQADWLARHIRLGVRRLGDRRRALSLNGGWVSLPRACYAGQALAGVLRLSHPVVAGLFAHELLHALQRRQGLAVTRQSLGLQCRMLLTRHDPYVYARCEHSRTLLRQFWSAQVEQQAQMWQDHVSALVAGQPLASHRGVALAVRAGRFRRR
jgi:hypothetical protein